MKKIHLAIFYGYNIYMEIPTKEYKKKGLDEKYWQDKYFQTIKEYYQPEKPKKWWKKLW